MTDDNLAKAMTAAAAEIGNDPIPMRKPGDLTDFDRLITAGEKLLHHQQQKAIRAQSDYQKTRTRILDDYRVQMDRQRIQAEEDLRQLDNEHKQIMAQYERTIMALKGLRGE